MLSDDGVPPGVLQGGGEEAEEGDVQSQLAEQVDLLGDKKLVCVCACVCVCRCVGDIAQCLCMWEGDQCLRKATKHSSFVPRPMRESLYLPSFGPVLCVVVSLSCMQEEPMEGWLSLALCFSSQSVDSLSEQLVVCCCLSAASICCLRPELPLLYPLHRAHESARSIRQIGSATGPGNEANSSVHTCVIVVM